MPAFNTTTSITGILEKVRYQKPDSHWGIFSVAYKDNDGTKRRSSFTGVMPVAAIGTTYTFEGAFEVHPQYGDQFKFVRCTALEKETKDGAFALLSSNRFKGVGPVQALAIVNKFGDRTLEIIRNEPKRLTEISGIGEKRAMAIHASMPNIGVWEQLRMLLNGSTDNAVNKIYEKYSDKSVEIIKKNPYTLIKDVDGFGFYKADAIASSVGIVGDNPLRVQAAIYHCLDNAAQMEGHCFSYATNLQVNVDKLIPGVDVQTVADAILELTKPGNGRMQLHVDPDGAIYLAYLWKAETDVAAAVRRMTAKPKSMMFTQSMVESAAEAVMHHTGIMLDDTQKDAVLGALSYQLSVITGGPGTGKTTIVRTIIEAIEENQPRANIALLAPTGRAAGRMSEATGHEASTIHAALHLSADGGVSHYNKDDPFPYEYVIIDESSMIDIHLAARLFNAIDEKRTRLVFIGDIDQLPSVGPGVFFRDIMRGRKVPTMRLKFSFRSNGSVDQNANKINNGSGTHSFNQDDFFKVTPAKKEDGPQKAIKAYLEMVKKYGITDTVLLSPTRRRGEGGTNELNKAIQKLLIGTRDEADIVHTTDFDIGLNDRVMLTKNGIIAEHANGDVGTVVGVTNLTFEIAFDGGDHAVVERNLIKHDFILAYASTIHKSQGSEYSGVVLLFTNEHQFIGERALLYTGVTRTRTECELVCDARAVNAAIAKVKPITRNSKLAARINEP